VNPNTMTCDECRDELARRKGWREAFRHRHASGVEQWCWERDGGDESFDHPYPPTLDGAAGALPEGWTLRTLYQCDTGWVCSAMLNTANIRGLIDQPDELTARYRLAVACHVAMEKTT